MKKTAIKSIIFIAIIIIIVLMAARSVMGIMAVVKNGTKTTGEKDPMFAEPMEIVTRPPEMDREEVQPEHATLDDLQEEGLTIIEGK